MRRLALALLVMLCAARASAQVTTGTILGTVRDTSGGVLAGAEVGATNQGTGFTRRLTADAEGQFVLNLLPLGEYRLEASAPSFRTFVRTGIVVEVGRNARVDPVLEIGQLSEVVETRADSPLVDTVSAAIGRTVTQQEILNLPLVNRNVYSLLSLTAGVDHTESTQTFGYQSQITIVNGSPDASQGAVNYFLDGGSNVGGLRNTGNSVPNPDAIQEFRVVTNSYSAEYGRFGGGAVDVITKSGTNIVQGSLFEFFRHDALNARRWTPGTSALKDPLERHQFGGSVGGPLRREKTFFFGSYSGLRQETTVFKNTAVVPTALERAGDFSASAVRPRDPLTGQPFPGGIIPVSRFDPTSARILRDWIPTANLPGNFFEVQQPRPTNGDELQVKIDHALNGAHQLAGSYFYNRRKESVPLNGTLAWTVQDISSRQHNLNLSDNWVIGSSAVNTARFTFVRHFGSRVNTPGQSLGDLGSRFQIQGPPSLPQIQVSGYFNLNSTIFGPTAGSDLFMARDVLNLSKGRHTIKLGGEFSYEKMTHDTTLNNYGVFAFMGGRTGNALVDFLLGLPTTMNQDAPIVKTDNVAYLSGFAQDDFRVGDRLTLNLGVRYDLQAPPTDPLNRKVTYVPGRQSAVVPTALPGLLFPGDEGVERGIIPTDRNNIAPRIGVAWDPNGDGRTAVRAGFGLFYGSLSGNEWNQTADQQPFTIRQRFNDVFSLSDPYRNFAGGVSPYPYEYNPASPRFVFPATVHGPSVDFVLPYTYQMNVSLQREILPGTSVTVAYVGAIGRKFPIARDINYPVFGPTATTANVDARRPILPGRFGRISIIESILGTDYHGIQVSGEKRGSRLTAKGNYTYGRALEDADLQDTTLPGNQGGAMQNPNKLADERGRTDNNRRHSAGASIIWNLDYLDDGAHRILRALADGWTLSAIVTMRSGTPFTVTTGRDNNLDGINNDRPNLVGDWKVANQSITQWFNTAAFTLTANGQDGNAPRNFIDGPSLRTVDLGLFRDVALVGRSRLQLRVEATNALNTVNFDNPGSNMNAPATFGRIRGARNMREIQLGVRLSF